MKQIPDMFNTNELTFYTEDALKAGMTVEIDSDGKIKTASKGSRFAGVCTKVSGNYATVALTGIVTTAYTGNAPACGFELISADGDGNIKSDITSDVDYLILNVNEEEHLVTFML